MLCLEPRRGLDLPFFCKLKKLAGRLPAISHAGHERAPTLAQILDRNRRTPRIVVEDWHGHLVIGPFRFLEIRHDADVVIEPGNALAGPERFLAFGVAGEG